MKQLSPSHLLTLCMMVLVLLVSAIPFASAQDDKGSDSNKKDSEIVVARLTYDNGKTAVCFADQFLTTYSRETGQNVKRGYDVIALDSDDLFEYPFVVFSGQESFELSKKEKANLKTFIERGGFVLASAGCSNNAWARSFEAVIAELFGEDALIKLDTDHALFHTVYDIDTIDVRRAAGRTPIQAMTSGDRVRVLYSPLGLNDTRNAGGDCCCCGGSEIKNARLINVNALGYALTR